MDFDMEIHPPLRAALYQQIGRSLSSMLDSTLQLELVALRIFHKDPAGKQGAINREH